MSFIDLREPIPRAPNFSYSELTFTTHRLFLHENRRVPQAFQPAAIALAANLAQPIRAYHERPLIVHSGYRCPALNQAIGGSSSSQHMKFEAIDFHVVGVPLQKTFDWIWRKSGMMWGQLILEGWNPDQGDVSWIHLSLGHPDRAEERSMQVLTYSIQKARQRRDLSRGGQHEQAAAIIPYTRLQ